MYLEIIDWLLVNTVNMKKKTYCFAAQPEEILFHRAPKSRGIFPQNSLNFFSCRFFGCLVHVSVSVSNIEYFPSRNS